MKGALGEIGTFMGIPIKTSNLIPEKQPTIELSLGVNVSDEFRKKTNAWYIKMFGYKTVCYMVGDTMTMNPKTFAKLEMQSYKQGRLKDGN